MIDLNAPLTSTAVFYRTRFCLVLSSKIWYLLPLSFRNTGRRGCQIRSKSRNNCKWYRL